MALPIEVRPDRKEGEPEPKALVIFNLNPHVPFNLQTPRRTIDAFDEMAMGTKGKKIFFFESSGSFITPSAADRIKRGISQDGLLTYLMRGWLSNSYQNPTVNLAETRIRRIQKAGLVESLREGLIPTNPDDYVFFQGLDRSMSTNEVQVEPETHSKDVIDRLNGNVHLVRAAIHDAVSHWENGEFEDGLQAYKKFSNFQFQRDKLRESEIVEFLKRETRTLLKGEGQGLLFVNIGNAHWELMEDLRRKLGPNIPLKIAALDHFPNTPYRELRQALSTMQQPSDLVYARNFLYEVISMSLQGQDLNVEFGNNFEEYNSVIAEIIGSMSLDDIRVVCESRTKVLELIKSSPLASNFKDYL